MLVAVIVAVAVATREYQRAGSLPTERVDLPGGVSDGRRGRVRAGGGERGSTDGLNRREEPLLASRFAEARHA